MAKWLGCGLFPLVIWKTVGQEYREMFEKKEISVAEVSGVASLRTIMRGR